MYLSPCPLPSPTITGTGTALTETETESQGIQAKRQGCRSCSPAMVGRLGRGAQNVYLTRVGISHPTQGDSGNGSKGGESWMYVRTRPYSTPLETSCPVVSSPLKPLRLYLESPYLPSLRRTDPGGPVSDPHPTRPSRSVSDP